MFLAIVSTLVSYLCFIPLFHTHYGVMGCTGACRQESDSDSDEQGGGGNDDEQGGGGNDDEQGDKDG